MKKWDWKKQLSGSLLYDKYNCIGFSINEKGRYNRIFIDTNKIATVFGRGELQKYIKNDLNSKVDFINYCNI